MKVIFKTIVLKTILRSRFKFLNLIPLAILFYIIVLYARS